MPSEIEHWHINATVYKDRVEEVHYVSDPRQNIRRKPETIVWQVERFLGRGTFGEVRLERNKADGSVRAVKRIATTNPSLKNSECERELKALLEFSKPKSREAAVFVDFLGWFKDQSDVFLAMEFIPLGDLETNVKAHSGRLPEIEAQEITEQILSGLEIMHAESFAHRDLKPQNILVVHGPPRWWIKIADFGLSKRLTESTSYTQGAGSLVYMAPEMLGYIGTNPVYTNVVDIWAVGCILYRLLAGHVPFPPGPTLGEFCRDTSLLSYEVLGDSGIPRYCSGLIKQLLVPEPSKRLSASEALSHRWIVEEIETPPISAYRPLTPSGLSETMSKLRFDTVSHAGLHSYRFAKSAEGKLEVPPMQESDEDLDREAMLRERLRERLRDRQEGSTQVQQAQKETRTVEKTTDDEIRERVYHEKKLRDKDRKRRPEKARTYQAYVEDESSDPETYPGLRTAENRAQRKLEKEIRNEVERKAAIRAEAAEAARVESLPTQNDGDAARAQIKEAPLDPRWSDHMDMAAAYMAAARQKITRDPEVDIHPHPGMRRTETFQLPPSSQYNVRYATAADYSDDDTPRRSSNRSSSPIKEALKNPKWAAHREYAAEYMRAARRKPVVETSNSELPHPAMRRSEPFSARPFEYEVRYAAPRDYSEDDTPRRSSARTPRGHKQSGPGDGSDGIITPERSSTKSTSQYNVRYATTPQQYSDDDAPRRSSAYKKSSSSATPSSSKPKKSRRKSSQLGHVRTKNQKEAKLVG